MPKTTSLIDAATFVSLNTLFSPVTAHDPKPEDGGPCHLCTARCCKYFAVQIDTPEHAEDFDHIRWYLMHEAVVVWVQDRDWYLEVRTRCRHLQSDNSCGIYESRPQICRDYGLPESDPCEYFTDDLEYDLFFESDDQLMKWLELRKKKKKTKRGKDKS